MATIRAYTTIEQSRKLAEILPLESADMYYFRQIDNDYFPPNVESICPIPLFKDGKEDFNYDIRCWSLAALLGVLPKYELYNFGDTIQLDVNLEAFATEGDETLLDLVVNMIIHLHDLKIL